MARQDLPAAPTWRTLGLIAGGGALPVRVAEACVENGRCVVVAAIRGFAAEEDFAAFNCERISIGRIGAMIDLFKKSSCDAVSFAGIVKRPDLGSIQVDVAGAKLLPKLVKAARGGDDALLRVVIGAFEKAGFQIVAPEDIAANLIMPAGPLGAISPSDQNYADIEKAFEVARALGRLDVGQGAVVCDGLVLAVEAQEGTDALLARVRELPGNVRGEPGKRRGVLAKIIKPSQDRRVDLPTIGAATVEGVARSGLAGLAVEAGGAFILERAAAVRAADAAGVFIIGVPFPDQNS